MIMLFGLILFLNINTSAATPITNVSLNKELPKVISVDPANHSIIPKSKGIKIKFNESVKFGTNYIELRNIHGTIPVKKIINGKSLYIIPKTPLISGFKYNIQIHTGSLVATALCSKNGPSPLNKNLTLHILSGSPHRGRNRATRAQAFVDP